MQCLGILSPNNGDQMEKQLEHDMETQVQYCGLPGKNLLIIADHHPSTTLDNP